ncbi:MAG: GWxTD domain-containing protein [Acidobacteriota bacterium]
MFQRVLFISGAVTAALMLPLLTQVKAQQQQKAASQAKPQTDKQKRQNEAKLRKELETPYKKWMNEEVVWIISDEERTAFGRLETDDERQSFIEQFWLRRDPSPDTEENEFREEHYRRIAWANDRFASGIPGWKTDRGMIYVKFGAPDERTEHPTGGPGVRPIEEGGGETTFFPYEQWRYRYLDGVGQDITIEFVDKSMTNEYRMAWDPSEKDALLRVPGAGLTLYEQMGISNKNDRFFNNSSGMMLGQGPLSGTAQMNMFDRLQRYVNVQKAPSIKFKDLDAMVNSTIKYNLLPMQVRVDYIPVTESNVLASITIQFNREDLQFRQKEGVAEAMINLRSSLTTMTRKPVGHPNEQTLEVRGPAEQLAALSTGHAIYNYTLSLLPGRYKLTVIAKDVVGENATNYDVAVDVPAFSEDRLMASSLILADQLEKTPTRSIGTGQFVIGSSKVRPRIDETFKSTEVLGIYMQAYNFETNEETRKPEGNVAYKIVRNGSNETVFEFTEDLSALSGGASQLVIEKKLPLAGLKLTPGDYTLHLTVTDKRRNETLTPSAKFKII